MIKNTEKWLKNPKRDFASGLIIFNACASPEIKAKYGSFLNEDVEVKPNDARYNMLLSKVSQIHRKMLLNPAAFTDISPEQSTSEKKVNVSTGGKQVKTDPEKLDLEKLPKALQAKYNRTKDIVPLMAKIHSELSSETISDEERLKKAEELCALDDERRSIWDEIDDYRADFDKVYEDKDINEGLPYSENEIVKGMQVAKRIERLEENIKRSQESADKYKGKNANLESRALSRVTKYQTQLDALKELVSIE